MPPKFRVLQIALYQTPPPPLGWESGSETTSAAAPRLRPLGCCSPLLEHSSPHEHLWNIPLPSRTDTHNNKASVRDGSGMFVGRRMLVKRGAAAEVVSEPDSQPKGGGAWVMSFPLGI